MDVEEVFRHASGKSSVGLSPDDISRYWNAYGANVAIRKEDFDYVDANGMAAGILSIQWPASSINQITQQSPDKIINESRESAFLSL